MVNEPFETLSLFVPKSYVRFVMYYVAFVRIRQKQHSVSNSSEDRDMTVTSLENAMDK